MKRLIFPFIAVIIVLSGCDKNPVVSDDYIDENLYGEWYKVSSNNSNYSPDFLVDGFQITRERKINNLGLEFNTGKMKVFNDGSTSNIIKANEGTIIYKRSFSRIEYIDTLTYKRQGTELFIYTKWDTSKFYKTDLNSVIKEPIECNVSFNIDSISFENLKVYYNPTAYISKFSDSEVSLWCYTGRYFIHINISDFYGAGTYTINYSKAVLGEYNDDVVYLFKSDSVYTGSFVIDQFDEVNSNCKGRFNFTATAYDGYSVPIKHYITNAEFSVPIYK